MNMNNWLESKWFYELHSSHVGEEGNMKSLKVRIANFWLKHDACQSERLDSGFHILEEKSQSEFGSGDLIEKVRVLPRKVHLHSGTDAPLNVTFLRAPPEALLKIDVPLVFRGDDVSPGLRKGGYLNTIKRTVKFLCPADIVPPGFVVKRSRFRLRVYLINPVVAISLRNELRGPRQNEPDWYKYISEGARVVHKRNPHVLVFVSGLNFDLDLSFLQKRPLALDLDNKLVYEIHWYSFSQDQNMWKTQPTNIVCYKVTQSFINRAVFLTTCKNPAPLVLSEFGFDQREVNLADNLYMTCLMAYAAETDLDWALWALQGSYYLRGGLKGAEETFGALDSTWQRPRNPNFLERLRFLQTKTHVPTTSRTRTSYIIFHPLSGNCVNANARNELYASNRGPFSRWSYGGDGTPIRLMDRSLCLKVVGDGLPPMLSNDCQSKQSAWSLVSSSKLHLATKDDEHGGELLCLQISIWTESLRLRFERANSREKSCKSKLTRANSNTRLG
ncbi:hypothetical protein CUMW_042570 [Citrus unshiu]|nr:hypothetical protein CUMW_042570 [Citrus unshiu]